ncbi:hypothetical protein NL529_34415, partial [Klebsiella pneumoniae]|nr:hypothetical protein [Klebsiella pneumoniae]
VGCIAAARPTIASGPDPCGNAATVNQSYTAIFGTVVEVPSGDRIRVEMDPEHAHSNGQYKGRQEFRLVAIEAPSVDG